MKIIFAGPTIQGIDPPTHAGLAMRGPARQGDFFRAVEDGANVIGLIDGVYEQVPAIWHKEILYALSKGVRVFGAASMGALRAAECAHFGMVGIGAIFEAYASGQIEDDADVAQLHGPKELNYLSLSEPMVNVTATLDELMKTAAIDEAEHAALKQAGAGLFFKQRTLKAIAERADLGPRTATVLSLLRSDYVNLKRRDAQLLIQAVLDTPDARVPPPGDWIFHATAIWTGTFGSAPG